MRSTRGIPPFADVRLSAAVFVAGAAATAVFLVSPSGSVGRTVAWSIPFVLAMALLLIRFVVSPPVVRAPLRPLSAGAAVYVTASFVWYVVPVHLGSDLPFPSWLDAMFFAAYALYATFLFGVVGRRAGNRDVESRLAATDTAIFTLALSAVLWVAVVEPHLELGMDTLATMVVIGYPVTQLVLFALAIRLLASFNGLVNRVVFGLLLLWISAELVTDVFYGVQSGNGSFRYDGPLVPSWMLAYTALAALAVHPGLTGLLESAGPTPAAARRSLAGMSSELVRRLRLGMLSLAGLLPLTLAVLSGGLDLALVTVSAVVFVLALYRTSLLAGDLAEQRRLGERLGDALAEVWAQHRQLSRLGAAVEASRDAIVMCSPEGVILDWNGGAERLYGFDRDDVVGQHFGKVVLPAELEESEATMAQVARDGHHHIERAVTRKDGTTVEVEASLSSVYDAEGQLLGIVAISRGVTERNELQRALLAHGRRLDEAQRLAGVGSFEQDLVTGRGVWSTELHRILDSDERTCTPSFEAFLERTHPDDRKLVRRQNALAGPGRPMDFEARLLRPDGRIRWVHVCAEVSISPDGLSRHVRGSVHDITAQKTAEEALERLAHTDTLTGLANRDRFTRVLRAALDEADGEGAVGLLLLDLDGFKDVNDGIGHHAGDLVLQEVARRVSAALRSGDEVARLGGDEFAIVLPDMTGVEDAITVATNVRACLEPAFDLDGMTVHVGGSIGIAVSAEESDPGALLKQADVAMYRAKTLSSGWAVFAPDQDDLAAGRLKMVADLRETIGRGELEIAYQPILDTRSRRVNSFEALARWHHPDKGVIPSDQFIPLAEQADLIVPLTRLVLRKAVAACAAWRDSGHDLRVGVNLSIQVMHTEDPSTMVSEALADAGLEPQHLILEITESSLASDGDRLSDVLHTLRELGVTLVIDDFGTGYSAMSYLKQLPVQELKIDRSFIRDIATDTRDLAIVRSLIRLGHSLSLRVVAEGVESVPALEVLTGLGCDFAQGYGIARPMPEADTAEWLARFNAPSAVRVSPSEPTDLLIVDDSEVVRAYLSAAAREAGWRVRQAASAEEAIAVVERSVPDVVVLDHQMTGMSGIESVAELRARGVDGPILLFTGFLSDAIPSLRVPLDVWPVSKSNPKGVLELLEGYRASAGGSRQRRRTDDEQPVTGPSTR